VCVCVYAIEGDRKGEKKRVSERERDGDGTETFGREIFMKFTINMIFVHVLRRRFCRHRFCCRTDVVNSVIFVSRRLFFASPPYII